MRFTSLRPVVAPLSALALLFAAGCPRVSPAPDGLGTENYPPVAVAFASGGSDVGVSVSLDGNRSYDPNLDAELTYEWTLDAVPSGSTPALTGADTASASFVPEVLGRHLATLTVSDGTYRSQATVAITVGDGGGGENRAPLAVITGQTSLTTDGAGLPLAADLSGASSTDPDGDALTFTWSLPGGGTDISVRDASASDATFDLAAFGSYPVQLEVSDGELTATQTVTLTLTEATNQAPTAVISGPATVEIGNPATLDGTGSSDPEGQPLTYTWSLETIPAGSALTISDPTVSALMITPDLAGGYDIGLVVSDGQQSAPMTVHSLLATDPAVNNPPVAAIAAANLVQPGQTVDLDGTGSLDPDGDALTYLWSLDSVPAGSAAALSATTTDTATFTADLAGDYVVSLSVDDGEFTDPETLTVTADAPPLADIGGLPPSVPVGTNVSLDGTGSSDPEGQSLAYAWTLVPPGGSAAVLTPSATDAQPSFVTDVAGTYLVRLMVNDGSWDSSLAVATVAATASTGANNAPIANAGPDQTAAPIGTYVQFDGSLSSDPDLDPLLYAWSLVSMPAGAQVPWLDAGSVQSPQVWFEDEGTYVFALVVSDGRLSSAPDTVTIQAVNLPPVADAGADFFVPTGTLASLEAGLSSDPNDDALSYLWSLLSVPAGSTAALFGSGGLQPSFVPDLDGDYLFELTVYDDRGASATDQVTVTASSDAPIADAGLVQGAFPGETVTLDGSGSIDPRALPAPLGHAWVPVLWPGSPGEPAPVLTGASTDSPTFLAIERGTYRFQLVVTNDVAMASAPDAVEVIVRPPHTVDAGADFVTMLGNWNYYPRLHSYAYPSVSSDVLARPLDYSYEVIAAPAGSAYAGDVRQSSRWNTGFDLPGVYQLRLTVTDLFGVSVSDVITITAEEPLLTVVSGDGQSGTVDQPLPQPLRVEMSSASGLPAGAGVPLIFTAPGQLPLEIETDSRGEGVSGSMPLGTVAGPQTIQVRVLDWPTATATATATGVAGTATAIIFERPADTSVDGTMLLEGRVVDAFLNTVTTSSLEGTVTCDGSAIFGAVTVGTEVSRPDPQEVVFQAAGGLIGIEVTDTVAELVNLDFVDSQNLGVPAFGPTVLVDTDLEASEGGFVAATPRWSNSSPNDDFAWGPPTAGPGAAHSGNNVWGTNLSGNHRLNNESIRELKVDLSSVPALGNVATMSVWHWEDFPNTMCPSGPYFERDAGGIAFVAKDEDGGDDDWEDLLIPIGGAPYDGEQDIEGVSWPYDRDVRGWLCPSGGWRESVFDISPYAGQIVDFQFVFIHQTASFAPVGPGFYFDDVRIDAVGAGTTGRFLAGASDVVTATVASPAPVGDLLRVDLELEDQFGGLAVGDSSSTFSVSVGGSATFVSAVAGSILSGAGTNAVQVQATAGRVSLFVTDAVREQVTFGLSAPTPATLDVSATATGYFTGPPLAICVRGGDAQTGTVGTALPLDLEVQVIDEADCLSATAFGVQDDILFVPTPADDALLDPLFTGTDATGTARTTLTLPDFPVAVSVDAVSQSNPALTATLTATAEVGPAAEVVVLDPSSSQIGQATLVTLEVRDALDNAVNTDSSTVVRLRAEGAALFGNVTTGSLVSGLGNSIEVQVAAGVAQVELTSGTPGRFALWTEDSQSTGLTMSPRGYDGRVFDHPYATDLAPSSTFTFLGLPPVITEDATLHFRTDADINSTNEYWDVTMEGGVSLGTAYNFSTSVCWPNYMQDTIVLPAAPLSAAAVDGQVSFDLTNHGVSGTTGRACGTNMQMLDLHLRVPGAIAFFADNDTCLTAATIGRGTFLDRGTNAGASDTFPTSCNSFAEPGPDVVYTFTPTGSGRSSISVLPLDGQNLDWSLTTDCADIVAGCMRSERYDGPGLPEAYSNWPIDVVAGTQYYLIINSPDSTVGEFELSIELPQ